MKKILLIFIFVLVSFCFSAIYSHAYDWKTYTVSDGLKDNLINTVTADEQFVWFGTKNGASRFDGRSFVSYLDGYDIQTIVIENNRVWFGTERGVFLKEGERLTPFLQDLVIQDIAIDQQGV
jgi:ligand-binding sensor domain-containing protein